MSSVTTSRIIAHEDDEQSTCFSIDSNHVGSIFQNDETPKSYQKVKLRRSKRRRTLAPLFNDPNISCFTPNHMDSSHSNSFKSLSTSLGKRDWKDSFCDDKQSTTFDNATLYEERNDRRQDNDNDKSLETVVTPLKQKRMRKNQRRRSLATQNGRLLLKKSTSSSLLAAAAELDDDNVAIAASNTSSSSPSNSGLPSQQTMSSLSVDSFVVTTCDKERVTLLSSSLHHENMNDMPERCPDALHDRDLVGNDCKSSSSSSISSLCSNLRNMMNTDHKPSRRSARIRMSMARRYSSVGITENMPLGASNSERSVGSVKFRLSTLSPLKSRTKDVSMGSSYDDNLRGCQSLDMPEGNSEKQRNDECHTIKSVVETTSELDSMAKIFSGPSSCENEKYMVDNVPLKLSTLSPNVTSSMGRGKGENPSIVNYGKDSNNSCVWNAQHKIDERFSLAEPSDPRSMCDSNSCTTMDTIRFRLSTLSPIEVHGCPRDISSLQEEKEAEEKEEEMTQTSLPVADHGLGKSEKHVEKNTECMAGNSKDFQIGTSAKVNDTDLIHQDFAETAILAETLVTKGKSDDAKSVMELTSHTSHDILANTTLQIKSNAEKSLQSDIVVPTDILTNSNSAECRPFSNPDEITAEEIKTEMKAMFHGLDIDTSICVSSRLFGYAMVRLKRNGKISQHLAYLYPILRSFVEAELAALENLDIVNNHTRKKICFCSFNFSSTITPIDTSTESCNILEACIWKLEAVIKEIQILSSFEYQDDNINLIKDLINTFGDLENGAAKNHFEECSKAMPFCWPISRFTSASRHYRQEFSYILSVISCSTLKPPMCFVRKTLGDFIGRLIRFHLRRFFNPVPVPLYSDGDDLPDYSNTRSRVHTLVQMKDDDEGGRDTATADGSISSVFGIALDRMVEFFELNKELLNRDDYHVEGGYSTSFCKRPASVGGLIERGCVIELSEEDANEVLQDIKEGHTILAGIRACRFIKELLTWPGVSEALHEAGGWTKIETFADMFMKHRLGNETPEESHFTLLANMDRLLNKILIENDLLLVIEQRCEDSLRRLWKKFRCGTRNKELLQLNPCIKVFHRELMHVDNKTKFPSLVKAMLTD